MKVMMMLSDFVITLLQEWKLDDLPVNVLIDGKYYDIEEFFFDKVINEYILKIDGAIDYATRGDVAPLIFNIEIQGDKK